MRILHFAHSYLPIQGGTTTRLYNLLQYDQNNHYLYVPKYYGGYQRHVGVLKDVEMFGNVKVHRFNLVKSKLAIPIVKSFRETEINSDRLVNFVTEKKIDIVHGHNPIEFALASMKYAKKNNIPLIYEAHGLISGTLSAKSNWNLLNPLFLIKKMSYEHRESMIFQEADIVITQTNAIKQKISHKFGIEDENIKVIPNGVDVEKFNPVNWHESGDKLRKEKGWDDKTIFMYSGFLDDINGIPLLLNTIKELPNNIKSKIKVLIIGRGPLQEYVENFCKEESLIEYLGVVDYNDMPLYYSLGDVFVIPRPSTLPAETLTPMKLLEAMAMEKVVLGSDVGGITEVLSDKNGVIFRKGDSEDLLNKITHIVENIEGMDGLREEARRSVISNFTWEKSRNQLKDVYEEIIC